MLDSSLYLPQANASTSEHPGCKSACSKTFFVTCRTLSSPQSLHKLHSFTASSGSKQTPGPSPLQPRPHSQGGASADRQPHECPTVQPAPSGPEKINIQKLAAQNKLSTCTMGRSALVSDSWSQQALNTLTRAPYRFRAKSARNAIKSCRPCPEPLHLYTREGLQYIKKQTSSCAAPLSW